MERRPHTPRESYVDLRQGRFKIRLLEAGSGPPLVFLHGVGGLFWDPLLDALAGTHRVLAPEHPGAGTSQGLEHVEDLWDLVLYYNELLDELGIERAVLVGHSFGGMVAAELAATSPQRVERLVLMAPIGLWRDDHPVPDFTGVPPATLPALLFADPTGPAAASLPGPDPLDPDSLLRASQTTASILQFTWPLPDKGLKKRLYRVSAPTLLVWGDQDRLVDPAYADDFQALIRGAQVRIVEGAGHVLQMEQPDATIEAITDFLAA